MSNLFSVLWELEIHLLFCFINLKLVVEIVFCSEVVWIMTWEDLKFSIFAKDFSVILVGFDFFIKTADFLPIFIDESTVDIQLINVLVFLWYSSEVESIDPFPFNISREAIIQFFDNSTQFVLVNIHILRNCSNVSENCLFYIELKLIFKFSLVRRPLLPFWQYLWYSQLEDQLKKERYLLRILNI